LTVRMTSAAGEERSFPAQAAQCAAFASIPFNERSAQPAFRMAPIQGPARGRICRSGCWPDLPT
jgi:hypothetical protein